MTASSRRSRIASRFGLTDVLDRRTASLAYGKQRLLEIALAFACKPRVLLLDEPAAGVPEAERPSSSPAVAALPARGRGAVDRARHGSRLRLRGPHLGARRRGALDEGPPDEIAKDARVRAVYLGEAQHG